MGVTVCTDWKYNDIPTVILENEWLRCIVMPELGGKIWQITYKPKGKDLLWNHPRLRPRKVPFHSVYDDHFFGGWDELFPNDIPEELNGEKEPDHGEVWTLPWQCALERAAEGEVTVRLWVDTVISNCRLEKWITLKSGEAKLRFRHKMTNNGHAGQPFLWKLHAALAVDENCRIDAGAGACYIEDFGPTRIGRAGISYEWPYASDDSGALHDMRRVLPASSRINEFQYMTDMKEGWCAVTHEREKLGFGLAFDLRVFPSCWLFAAYGGWRGLNTVILEPCTGYPLSVREGTERGTHRTLQAGETLECAVTAVVYDGLSAVTSITEDGEARGS